MELFANDAATTVTAGGTSAPAAGTVETWTVASSGSFPAVAAGSGNWFHVADPALPGEKIRVTGITGTTWTVTRGDEGSPAAHASGFTIRAAVTAGTFATFLPQTVLASGDTTGATDDANVQAALNTGFCQLAPGATYYSKAGWTVPGNGTLAGGHGPRGSVRQTIVHPVAGFTGAQLIGFTAGSTDQEIRDLCLDGTDAGLTAGALHGISATGPISYVKLRNLLVLGAGFGNGVKALNSAGNPVGWIGYNVTVRSVNGSGFNLVSNTDSDWVSCQAASCGSDGWLINGCQNSRYVACRGDRSVNGFHVTGSGWGTGGASGGATWDGCTSDRNNSNGCLVDSTGNGPMIFTGCTWRRDGSNGATTNAGLKVNGATTPVVVDGITVWPGTEDDGTGNTSPANGLSVSSSNAVSVESGYIQGVTTSVFNGGGNSPQLYVGPGVVQATGAPGSPVVALAPPAAWIPTPADQGYAGWTFDPTLFPQAIAGAALATAGVVYLWQVPVRVPVPVTNIRAYLTAAGVTLTAAQCFAGLYSSAGAKIGATADQSTNWAGTGLLDMALSGGPFTITPPFVWAALVFNGTTGPAFARMNALANGIANGKLAAASARYGTILTGQTSLPASITPGSIALAATEYWAALW